MRKDHPSLRLARIKVINSQYLAKKSINFYDGSDRTLRSTMPKHVVGLCLIMVEPKGNHQLIEDQIWWVIDKHVDPIQ